MHRLFVALRPPPEIRAFLGTAADAVPHARWQDDDQLHLTLRYIGEVDRHLAEDVATALARIEAETPIVAVAAVGRFDKRGRTDALWAGLTPHEALVALHHKIDRALIGIGLPSEHRAYLPHITLARLPRSAGVEPEVAAWLARHAALSSAAFTLDYIILYESTLGRAGASYAAIARWPLA